MSSIDERRSLMKRSLLATALFLAVTAAVAAPIQSGLQPGAEVPAYDPQHVAGPDKGTHTCPVCKYGARPAVQIHVNADSANAAALAEKLDHLVASVPKERELVGFVVYVNGEPARLQKLASIRKIRNIGLAYLKDGKDFGPDHQSVYTLYKINPAAKNTVIVYKDMKVVANFVDLDARDFGKVESAVKGILQ
jgi:protocatechuate 3,4-dioxygenase beta subunit